MNGDGDDRIGDSPVAAAEALPLGCTFLGLFNELSY